MPNVITHGLMAHDVIQNLEESSVTLAIQDFPQAYFFGSNGADYLFYYFVLKPFDGHQINSKMNDLGSRVHNEKINDFYEAGVKWLKGLEGEEELIFRSYLAGHLTHWALDSVAHPYVFFKTGEIEGDNRYHHFRFESMIDTMMVKVVKKAKLSDYPSHQFVKLSDKEKLVIAKGYQAIIKEIFGLDVRLKSYITAMNNMYLALHALMDKTSTKKKTFQFFEEKLLGEKWFLSKHLVSGEIDTEHDILNLQHKEWNHPGHPDWVYTTSFVDLYDQAVKRGAHVLKLLEDDLNHNTHSILDFIDNRDYGSGTNDGLPMISFDVIY